MWAAADKLRSQLDAANYKHIVLGFVFLKYIADSFSDLREKLAADFQNPDSEYYFDPEDYTPETYAQALADELEDRDYYAAANIFWVPAAARWDNLKQAAHYPLGKELPWGGKFRGVANLIDEAFAAIEQENPKLKNIIQRISGFGVSEATLIGLLNLFSTTDFNKPTLNGKPVSLAAKDILGHVYEYFLGEFAQEEGKKGGEYFTPKAIVSLIVEILQPYQGRVYDPAMGSGGFFVQTEKFIRSHQGKVSNISIYGQEYNPTTWRLAAMNMAIRGIEFDFGKQNADSFTNPQHIDKKMDFVMANPPFNVKEWWNESLTGDPRWQYGMPPEGNANFAWIQHMLYHLSPTGKIGLVLANGSMSSQTNGEGKIRQNLLQADLVEAMIALPNQLFANTQIPACIWIFNKAKKRKGEVLFIDARQLGYMKDRKRRDFHPEDIAKIADTYHNWQQNNGYQDIPAFCCTADLAKIEENDWVLTPGRYVGTPEQEDDGVDFAEKMQELTDKLSLQFIQSSELELKIKENLKNLGFTGERQAEPEFNRAMDAVFSCWVADKLDIKYHADPKQIPDLFITALKHMGKISSFAINNMVDLKKLYLEFYESDQIQDIHTHAWSEIKNILMNYIDRHINQTKGNGEVNENE
ncbi:type I restriction-modification system subunit M [Neisseria yangbaofengii]|uniref:class I SAM-dependent DNA methyltransferase n=1 Tax=Neisseria yangbaofengii TaxID=2709396 RepID=UPI001F1505B7|nr:type I restriction-modification system subunit M [Neisseria yangbaofengii]